VDSPAVCVLSAEMIVKLMDGEDIARKRRVATSPGDHIADGIGGDADVVETEAKQVTVGMTMFFIALFPTPAAPKSSRTA
jgi:hypothetical protein